VEHTEHWAMYTRSERTSNLGEFCIRCKTLVQVISGLSTGLARVSQGAVRGGSWVIAVRPKTRAVLDLGVKMRGSVWTEKV
jgi:hypothetical protein